MRASEFGKKAVVILTAAMGLSVAGCGESEPVNTETVTVEPVAEEISESVSETIEPDAVESIEESPEESTEEKQEENPESKEASADIGSQLQVIADNYDAMYDLMFGGFSEYPGVRIAVADLNHNGRLEAILSTCQGSGCFSITYFYEISEDYSTLEMLDVNGEKTSDQWGDIISSEVYLNDDDDYTVYDCYKKGDAYFYLIKDYCSSGWSDKSLAYYSYSITEGVTRDLLGICKVSPDSDLNTLIVHTRLLDSSDTYFEDKESFTDYMHTYWNEYEKQSSCAVKWIHFLGNEDYLESITASYEAFDPECGEIDVIDYDYEKFFSGWYQDYEFAVETAAEGN